MPVLRWYINRAFLLSASLDLSLFYLAFKLESKAKLLKISQESLLLKYPDGEQLHVVPCLAYFV
jgi:hypothetical protein